MDRRTVLTRGCQAAALAVAVVAAVAAPTPPFVHIDHRAALDALDAIRHGTGVYRAFADSLAAADSAVSQLRSVRQPWLLALWSLAPTRIVEVAYYVVVAGVAGALAAPMVRRPVVAVAVTAYLAWFGGWGDVEQWLLFEPWAVPLVIGACLAWTRGRDGLASACCVGATLIRELAVLLTLGFLVTAWRDGRPLRPWVRGLAANTAVMVVHWSLAVGVLADHGGEAALLGTGGPASVGDMTALFGLPAVVGLVVWAAGIALLWRSSLRPAIGLAAIPLFGILVARNYWGVLAMPLALLALGGLPAATAAEPSGAGTPVPRP